MKNLDLGNCQLRSDPGTEGNGMNVNGSAARDEVRRGKAAEPMQTKGKDGVLPVPLRVVMRVYSNYLSHHYVDDLRGKDC